MQLQKKIEQMQHEKERYHTRDRNKANRKVIGGKKARGKVATQSIEKKRGKVRSKKIARKTDAMQLQKEREKVKNER